MTSSNSNLTIQAKTFVKKGENIFQKKFEKILLLSLHSHSKMMSNESLTNNINEETLSNKLCKYMEKEKGKFSLGLYYFVRESAETNDLTDLTIGYTDIKAIIPNLSIKSSGTTSFTIECKIVDGYSTKNKLYIKEGMNRFIEGKYCCRTGIGGMIGFVRIKSDATPEHSNVAGIIEDINNKLITDFKKQPNEKLNSILISGDYNNSFQSNHRLDNSEENLSLFHLMLDVSAA